MGDPLRREAGERHSRLGVGTQAGRFWVGEAAEAENRQAGWPDAVEHPWHQRQHRARVGFESPRHRRGWLMSTATAWCSCSWVRGLRLSDWAIGREEEEVEMVFRTTVALLKEVEMQRAFMAFRVSIQLSRLNGDFCSLQAATMAEMAVTCVQEERRT
ncbi:hypothetical protein ABZP36_034647 [Zizania latifolia]